MASLPSPPSSTLPSSSAHGFKKRSSSLLHLQLQNHHSYICRHKNISMAAVVSRHCPSSSSKDQVGDVEDNIGAATTADSKYVRILDTTLRDGEQSPGASMTKSQKLEVARSLSRLGVDVIEAGFPASSPGSLEAVRAIADEIGATDGLNTPPPVICAMARCSKRDIGAAWDALKAARKPRVNTFIATSDIHLKHKLRKTREEVVRIMRDSLSYARALGFTDIEFTAEDASRSEREFLYVVLEEAIKAGATTLTIPDTVGCAFPDEYNRLIADIRANTRGIDGNGVILSAHCHDDLGLATANSLAAIRAGARQVEVTINGIGERAGNAPLEEVVMSLKYHKEVLGGLSIGINTKHIMATSKMVSEFSGILVQPNKAVVGANVFSHESGIHQDGILKYRGTYEILSAEDIGLSLPNKSGIVLGKNSGRHALQSRLLELGYNLSERDFDNVFASFKAAADKKKRFCDDDIENLVLEEKYHASWSLGDLQVTCGTLGHSVASVKLIDSHGKEKSSNSFGDGATDAAYKAIDKIIQVPVTVLELSTSSSSEGTDALNTAKVVLRGTDNNHRFSGSGTGSDIVASSAVAYLRALNKMLNYRNLTNASNRSFAKLEEDALVTANVNLQQ